MIVTAEQTVDALGVVTVPLVPAGERGRFQTIQIHVSGDMAANNVAKVSLTDADQTETFWSATYRAPTTGNPADFNAPTLLPAELLAGQPFENGVALVIDISGGSAPIVFFSVTMTIGRW